MDNYCCRRVCTLLLLLCSCCEYYCSIARIFRTSLHHDAHHARARAMVITRIFLLHHRARQQLLLSAVTHHQHQQHVLLVLMTNRNFMSISMLNYCWMLEVCDDARQRSTSIAHHHPTLFVGTAIVAIITGSSAIWSSSYAAAITAARAR